MSKSKVTGKLSRAKQKEINLDDYIHLNERTPISVWVGEFLHRNKKFREEWEGLLTARPRLREDRNIFERKYGIWCFVGDSFEKYNEKPIVQVFPPVRAMWGFSKDEKEKYDSHRSEYSKRRKKSDPSCWTYKAAQEFFDPEIVLNSLVGQRLLENKFRAEKRLLISIDLRHPKSDIERSVKEVLDRIDTSSVKRYPKKWRDYLIVYDLKIGNPKASDNTINERFEKLKETETGVEITGDDLAMGRYFRSAVKLTLQQIIAHESRSCRKSQYRRETFFPVSQVGLIIAAGVVADDPQHLASIP